MTTHTIHTYLAETKSAVTNISPKLIVLGNEAADLDSMISSIVYAYFLSSKKEANDKIIAPVMTIPREDFKLRPEAVYVFEKEGIKLADILFFDDIDFAEVMSGDAELVLVDHNKMAVSLEIYGDRVTSILDHHRDEALYPQAIKKVIEPVGSTSTLVGEALLDEGGDLIDAGIAMLLVGTILLDTVNLDHEAGRVTPKDEKIAAELLKKCPLGQTEYFENIKREKFNVSSLGTTDLLRKDYKEWNFGRVSCGIASVLLSVQQWDKKDHHLCQKFASYTKNRNLDVLLAMNGYTNPDFSRDLVVFCRDTAAHDELVTFLKQQDLELREMEMKSQKSCPFGKMTFYSQGNSEISRKKLQPMLDCFFTVFP